MKKILIVEDIEDLLETTAEILTIKGYEVITAMNAHSNRPTKRITPYPLGSM